MGRVMFLMELLHGSQPRRNRHQIQMCIRHNVVDTPIAHRLRSPRCGSVGLTLLVKQQVVGLKLQREEPAALSPV